MSPVAEVMGGFTEAGDAELTDRELMAQGAAQVAKGARQVCEEDHAAGRVRHPDAHAARTNGGHLSE